MNLLAIETSTECCSVALSQGDELIVRSELAPRRHAELLLPMCEAVLAEAGLSRRQLDAVAVGRGPGAFTGVRLAISAAQGIALALDLPVVPVSSLAALALQAAGDHPRILAVIDARMGEIYSGTFARNRDGLVDPIGPECVSTANALVVAQEFSWSVVGSGLSRYADIIVERLGSPPVAMQAECFPQAAAVAQLALHALKSSKGVSAEQALPVYLRDKVALTSKERQGGAVSAG